MSVDHPGGMEAISPAVADPGTPGREKSASRRDASLVATAL